jgi:hypothetical protein
MRTQFQNAWSFEYVHFSVRAVFLWSLAQVINLFLSTIHILKNIPKWHINRIKEIYELIIHTISSIIGETSFTLSWEAGVWIYQYEYKFRLFQ